jgi:peptidoglycan/LPS O-acetylase OafA/YrhL
VGRAGVPGSPTHARRLDPAFPGGDSSAVVRAREDRFGSSPPPPAGARLTALDGLRGLAALVVVVHHSVLTWPVLADQYVAANRASGTWWLTFTPLHLVWAGTEAVTVFFVLSALVLTLPFLGRPAGVAGWRSYYLRRLARLYVPVVVAVALAALLVTLFPRTPGPATSWWFDVHAVSVDLGALADDAVLVFHSNGINTALWSLKYEVVFSLLLPLYVLAARRLRSLVLLAAVGLLALAGLGTYSGSLTLAWLPVFGIGACIAVSRARLVALGARIEQSRYASVAWAAVGAVAVALLLAEWWARALYPPTPLVLALARPLLVAGAALVCVLAMTCPAARRLCEWRPVRRLGLVSFSLYLVHEPIVVSVASLVGGSRRGVAVTVVVGTVLSLVAAAIFHRLVEAPSQRLAAAVGRVSGGDRGRRGLPRHGVGEAHSRRLPPVSPPRGDLVDAVPGWKQFPAATPSDAADRPRAVVVAARVGRSSP